MATAKQTRAARGNIKKAQSAWRKMSSRAHARAQPEGRSRAKPATSGRGRFFHIEVRPKGESRCFATRM